jgi:hypothetical protein
MNIHESVTVDRLIALVEERDAGAGHPGVCLACGADAEGVEPDARDYECEECGCERVYGAEEALLCLEW